MAIPLYFTNVFQLATPEITVVDGRIKEMAFDFEPVPDAQGYYLIKCRIYAAIADSETSVKILHGYSFQLTQTSELTATSFLTMLFFTYLMANTYTILKNEKGASFGLREADMFSYVKTRMLEVFN